MGESCCGGKTDSTQSVGKINCPACGKEQTVTMSVSSCQTIHKCDGCGKTLVLEKSCGSSCDDKDSCCEEKSCSEENCCHN